MHIFTGENSVCSSAFSSIASLKVTLSLGVITKYKNSYNLDFISLLYIQVTGILKLIWIYNS